MKQMSSGIFTKNVGGKDFGTYRDAYVREHQLAHFITTMRAPKNESIKIR
jgi:hypothetical protein